MFYSDHSFNFFRYIVSGFDFSHVSTVITPLIFYLSNHPIIEYSLLVIVLICISLIVLNTSHNPFNTFLRSFFEMVYSVSLHFLKISCLWLWNFNMNPLYNLNICLYKTSSLQMFFLHLSGFPLTVMIALCAVMKFLPQNSPT